MTDCVLALDHRMSDQISTRRLRVLKYRGSAFSTNEYPYIIAPTYFPRPIASMYLGINRSRISIDGSKALDDA